MLREGGPGGAEALLVAIRRGWGAGAAQSPLLSGNAPFDKLLSFPGDALLDKPLSLRERGWGEGGALDAARTVNHWRAIPSCKAGAGRSSLT